MHVLGVGPVDGMLRHHGHKDGTIYPDGRVANLWSGGSCSVASAHFPIEEQGRRSNHGHGLIFNSRQKLDWLSDVLTGTTEEGRIRLLCVDQIFTIPVCHFSTVFMQNETRCSNKRFAFGNRLTGLGTVWPVFRPQYFRTIAMMTFVLKKPCQQLWKSCTNSSALSSPQAISTAWMLSRSLPAKLCASYLHGFLSVQHAVSLPPSEALPKLFPRFPLRPACCIAPSQRSSASFPIDTARPQENQRLETRHVGAAKQAFRARLPPILTVENLRKGKVLQLPP